MIRVKGKATKIAYKILGKPENLKDTKTYRNSKTDRRLTFEQTYRVR